MPGLAALEGLGDGVVVRLQPAHVRPRLLGQRRHPSRGHVLHPAAAGSHPEVVEEHAEVGVVVGPRSQEVVPGALEGLALLTVDHVPGEELVGALVLHLGDEGVVLGAVVGVVEGRGHRVLVRGVRLPVRVGGHEGDELGDAGPERPVARALRVPDEDPLAGHAGDAVGPVGEHHPDHRVSVGAELDVGVQLREVALVIEVELDLERPRGREVVRADPRAVDFLAEPQAGDLARGQELTQGEGLQDRPRHALARDGDRFERVG